MDEERSARPGLERILARLGLPDTVERLEGLSDADLTTLLLAVTASRARRRDPGRLLGRFREDRFVRPSAVPFGALRAVEDAFVETAGEPWDWVTLAPLVPFGTHAVLGGQSQDRVISTARASEVAADPTTALALHAASERRDSAGRRTAPWQRLASIQRIVRAQRFDSPEAFAHFALFALVTAGRSRPREGFDAPALVEHLLVHVEALERLGAERIRIALSTAPTSPGHELAERVGSTVAERPRVAVVGDPDRLPNQRYYRRACFKVHATLGGSTVEVADGGFVDWTERLLEDRRERCLISAAGLDRLALALGSTGAGPTGYGERSGP